MKQLLTNQKAADYNIKTLNRITFNNELGTADLLCNRFIKDMRKSIHGTWGYAIEESSIFNFAIAYIFFEDEADRLVFNLKAETAGTVTGMWKKGLQFTVHKTD